MKDENLIKVLKNINLNECEATSQENIFYIKKPIKNRFYDNDGTYKYSTNEYEFLIITNQDEKCAIILKCGTADIHWCVLKKWRNKKILSNALRTGILHEVWPENKTVSCCYDWRDKMVDRPKKHSMTKHLAELAGLKLIN